MTPTTLRAGLATLLLGSAALASAAQAQDTRGTITGTKDLDPAKWYVTADAGDGLSGWRRDGNEVEVRLSGHPLRESEGVTEGTLTIAFRTDGNPDRMEVDDFSLVLVPDEDGAAEANYRADATNATLEIGAMRISGDGMTLAGSFSGQLTPGGAEEIVADRDVPDITIDGNFQATIPRLDGEGG
ncbi:hypothetical protein [Pseudooceanicola sp.]|uniref:hypothetical protein n=1 Tax=Pseudooceanicola sp. TaxID=1914328 RepID=UPI004059EC0C